MRRKTTFIHVSEGHDFFFSLWVDAFEHRLRGEPFLIVDAGGGTVDLVAQMLSVSDKTGKILLSELVAGDGDLCGGLLVDRAFEAFLADFVGVGALDDLRGKNPDQYIKLIYDSWEKVKRNFDDNEDVDIDLDLPRRMSLWRSHCQSVLLYVSL